ncbi:hypothetical protein LTR02_003635 [Friedmanniomyces endolithicus]|nr:hypothetical protein LTR38_007305 [Friedmanniomyces endolithicus]KAK0809998.1 hypothetical protein LTR59_002400 [Friedmanniomyces endolithicus]KAK0846275.1 hypothetical protein LTR03_006928 [Friedmanniomyces endolithicus]KAK0910937.1 hypothetical protein LTR02_003635 [Friedmanniomyces endolithicus]
MKDSILTTLRTRELTSSGPRSSFHRSIYSSRSLIADLDIVNELDGHSGCVNALSWSRSGTLLASGSDDQHLNVHTYQPQSSDEQFKLTTTVATGHTQNIFSVKFMPHQNDRTVVTAAGDGEVRVFDLEYSGQAREPSRASSYAGEGRRRGRDGLYSGVRYINDGNTDCRVYRSHGDRVKRIVTESSPHLFLTCSEDGEVRQWDLRLPSEAYPSPRGREAADVPPPLISYKRYNLDLNTISCSPSQPHYIALGGAHMHCFLHDRRMTGRDRLQEAGKSVRGMQPEDEVLMTQATQCVRKFAPKGQQTMKRTKNGHITACKISDARPDEMVVSWSGDNIYSFDLVRSPDASDERTEQRISGLVASENRHRAKESQDRKRKRVSKGKGTETSLGQQAAAARGTSRPKTGLNEGAAALRVTYQNGQSEDIPISDHSNASSRQQSPLTEKQREAQSIARATVRIRSALFTAQAEGEQPSQRFTAALGMSASIMSEIDEAMREWRYPVDPTPETVAIQRTLRQDRESARRFIQAAGTLSRTLGGELRTTSARPSPLLAHFLGVEARSIDLPLKRQEKFGYDFLKAILLFLESGVGRLIEGFTRPASMSLNARAARRLPIPEDESRVESIDDILIPYLLGLASDRPIVNVEANRFETEDRRQLFPTERSAVVAFAAALRIPFADLSSATAGVQIAGEGDEIQAQDRDTARGFWAGKVARGVLLNAAEGLRHACVDRAFGGVGIMDSELREVEESLGEMVSRGEGEDGEQEELMREVEMLDADGDAVDEMESKDPSTTAREARQTTRESGGALPSSETADSEMPDLLEDEDVHNENDDDDNDEDDHESNDEEHSSEPDEIDGVPNNRAGLPSFIFNSAFERRRHKERVEAHVPCSPSTRTYRGHCNVRTVKDVNYLGPDDQYVASGSDDGNLFIWDRKTGELVNVLEGDGEVVNVVQSHPYETCLAVSGIDHTIKIFSPDARARERARLGDGVSAHDASQFSSLAFPRRLGGRRREQRQREDADPGIPPVTSEPAVARGGDAMEEDGDEDYVAPTGLASRQRMQDAYRITSRNDAEIRRGGNQKAFITVPHAQLLRLLFGGGMGFAG